jgi:GntR family transcriptional repressor for pyruvate dehydrogenase complex
MKKNLYFEPIKSKRTFEDISSQIKEKIFEGILKPGDKLPSEKELASQFKVGRQTIREALRLLELSGFITIQRGSIGGSYISNTIVNTLRSSFVDIFRIENISIEELTAARLEIEKVVLNHIFVNCSGSDIEILQNNILQAKEKIKNNNQAFIENIQFHILLAKASQNPIFVIVLESIMAVVADLASRHILDLENSIAITKDHEDILNAIIKKKHNEAITLFEKHLLEVKKLFQ